MLSEVRPSIHQTTTKSPSSTCMPQTHSQCSQLSSTSPLLPLHPTLTRTTVDSRVITCSDIRPTAIAPQPRILAATPLITTSLTTVSMKESLWKWTIWISHVMAHRPKSSRISDDPTLLTTFLVEDLWATWERVVITNTLRSTLNRIPATLTWEELARSLKRMAERPEATICRAITPGFSRKSTFTIASPD